ncbi:undecaprenyldiphospho-muramoylpentapeptide beta-N-acetylglucosaminyltransferase [Pontibacter sp. G13]|uniref:undecaprenyldiphospho-muramoylpentapeptide beta-N-acetylglucosaminyltransferase n=1 Tax=Pontibacter sp. G13 TaxID=3074898 RepID=UPI00288A745A|nr:undecaprenyldiphospho-muramoylpentapeptide beta-N-acetylglucosaminyltransferase [Pontibacter sp. G13]WNJ20254.1 undecaprenyldiphospho-muramoylpentapeptide beta-N-acetylglucosaminyltransferase [Pontibacter sp. G13]
MARKIIISGGGTGGHIFPAVSIANEIKRREPDADILFVGAEGGMELTVVPRYNYPIRSVWISGIQRQLTLKNISRNLLFPLKLGTSLYQATKIVNEFKPEAVVGVGGFASGPVGKVATSKDIPLFLCEQNAYPGLVNRWLASQASKILLGNEDAAKYFDKDKIVVTGNPIRSFELPDRESAAAKMGIDPDKPTLLSLGGSLGALTLNEALKGSLDQILNAEDVQLVWQCGKRYYDALKPEIPEHPRVKLMPFIEDMAAAYASADLIVSRAGGSTISELIALSKPSILVPSPNVAEDHQTKNALSLTTKGAALLVKDVDARTQLVPEALNVLGDQDRLAELTRGIRDMEKHDAAKEIVDQIFDFLG